MIFLPPPATARDLTPGQLHKVPDRPGTHTYYVAGDDGTVGSLVHNARVCNIAQFDVPRTSGIYVLRFGKRVYVGQSVNMHARIHQHLSAGGRFAGQTPLGIHTVRVPLGWLNAAEGRVIKGLGGIGNKRVLNLINAPR